MDPPTVEASQVSLTFGQPWVRLTFSQMYPLVEASGGQDQF